MQNIGELIRELRVREGYPLRKVAAFLDIDQAVLSKIERGQRKFSKEQVIKLAEFFNYNKKELLINYISDKIVYEIIDDDLAEEALKVAEEKIQYKAFKAIDKNRIKKQIIIGLKQFPKISRAWIYGSFARENDSPGSDIDIAVKTDKGFSYFDLAEVKYRLEQSLNKKIDIGFIDSFKPYILNNIENDLNLIYEK